MKLFSLRKWRLRHLLFSWCAYWIAIVAIKLGPAIAAAWTARREGANDGTSSVSADWSGTTGLSLRIVSKGVETWSGSASIASIVGWAVLPPLILWVIWLSVGVTARATVQQQIGEGSAREVPLREQSPSYRDPA